MSKIISFPNLALYHVPIKFALDRLLPGCQIRPAPQTTQKTLELGAKYSPDFVCLPFKYNLGNMIESLDDGAEVIIQAGGGCRFGYYAELQEQILNDLGYKFQFIRLVDGEKLNAIALYRKFKQINPSLGFLKFAKYMLLTIRMIKCFDNIDEYLRHNIGFEVKKGSFAALQKEFCKNAININSAGELNRLYEETVKKIKNVPLNKPADYLRVGIVGELYSLMEPFCNYFLEKKLSDYGVSISRFTNLSYLMFEKKNDKIPLSNAAGYLKYHLGADGTESVARSKVMAEQGYDGIIHLKPFGCTPELNAAAILQKLSRDYSIPIIYFSFDTQTSETGIETRLEAFFDMLVQRKQAAESLPG